MKYSGLLTRVLMRTLFYYLSRMNIRPDKDFDFIKYLESKGFKLIQRGAIKTMLTNVLSYNERLEALISFDETPILCPVNMPTLQIMYESSQESATLYLGIVPFNLDHAEIIFESITPEKIENTPGFNRYKEVIKRL